MDLIVNLETMGNVPVRVIKQQIAAQTYDWRRKELKDIPENPMLEDDLNHGLPQMNKVFYTMFISKKAIPSWTYFIEEYKRIHVVKDGAGLFTFRERQKDEQRYGFSFTDAQIDRRLLYAYMSFAKEPFVLYWFLNNGFESAYWSFDADKFGYDVVVPYRDDIYGIKIYSNTEKARKYAGIKSNSRNGKKNNKLYEVLKNSRSIALTTRFDDSVRCGDTYLFSDQLLREVKRMIELGIEPFDIQMGHDGQPIIKPGIIL